MMKRIALLFLALQTHKTDAVLTNNAIAALAVNRNEDLAHFPQELQSGAFGIAFAKGDARRDDWQAAYDAIPQETIEAVCEYSEAAERAEWMIAYGGPRLDAASAGDALALAVLKGMTTSMDYSFEEGVELQNRLRLVDKNG